MVAAGLREGTRQFSVTNLTGLVDCDKKVIFIPNKEVLRFGRAQKKHN